MLQSLLAAYTEKTDNGYLYGKVWTKYATALLSKVFLFTAIALIVALVVVGIFLRRKKPQQFSSFMKVAAIITVSFAVTVIVAMLSIAFAEIEEKGKFVENPKIRTLVCIPLIILACIVILGALSSYVCSLYSKKAGKTSNNVVLGLSAAALISVFVCLGVFFAKYADAKDKANVNQVILYISAAILIVAALAIAFLTDKKGNFSFDAKSIALAGICVALSFALSYIKLWDLPNGGSVTLASLLPIMIFSYIYGAKKGVFVGFVYGILQAVQEPSILHPAQFLLDYPIAFSMAGLAGVLKNVKIKLPQVKFCIGAIIAGAMRYVSHVIAGTFAFGSGDWSAFTYSLAYSSFVFVDIALVIIAGVLLLSSKAFVAETKKFAAQNTPVSQTAQAAQAGQAAQSDAQKASN